MFRLGQTSCHRAPIGIVRCSITTGGKSLGASQQGRTKWRTFCYLALLPVVAAAVDWPVGLAKREKCEETTAAGAVVGARLFLFRRV